MLILKYFILNDAAYCFPCRFFALNDSSCCGIIDDAFIREAFNSWHRATEKFKVHEKSFCHQVSIGSWRFFTKQKSVDAQINEEKELEHKHR